MFNEIILPEARTKFVPTPIYTGIFFKIECGGMFCERWLWSGAIYLFAHSLVEYICICVPDVPVWFGKNLISLHEVTSIFLGVSIDIFIV